MGKRTVLKSWRRFNRVRPLFLWVTLSSMACTVLLLTVLTYSSAWIGMSGFIGDAVIDLSNNYFQSVNDLATSGFLVNNEKCMIPDVDPWNRLVQKLITRVKHHECNLTHHNLTYVHNNVLVINEAVLQGLGYGIDDISCCYNVIERVEQSRTSYTKDADNHIKYSDECYKMEKATIPKDVFIKVSCIAKSPLGSFAYKNFHVIPMFPIENKRNRNMARKLSFWEHCFSSANQGVEDHVCNRIRESGPPPNILLLGVDSTSRINFRRFMHRTVKVLEKVINATEMLGYTKVGENTFPNFVPVMTSYSEDDLKKICYYNRWVPQDKCPYIWKAFAQKNYLTAHLEDSPKMAIFNYMKTGFIKPPVDIYLRPFMVGVYQDVGYPYTVDCIGNQRPEDVILDYTAKLVELAASRQIPYFITTWLTDLTHDDMNKVQLADQKFASTLLSLHEQGLLANTVLLVMSDHGYRFLDVRETTSGWYEDKLPAMWIKLPPSVTTAHPSWQEALHHNSRQLVTPFDVHEAIKEVLNTYLPATNSSDSRSSNHTVFKKYGKSIFHKLQMRNCEDAGIPAGFCACQPLVEYKSNQTFIKLAAEAIVNKINRGLPAACSKLSVEVVTASGTLNSYSKLENSTYSDEKDHLPAKIVLGLRTKPGNFRFEAWVTYNKTNDEFTQVSNILRMNQITTSTSCLSEKEMWHETTCYCDIAFGLFS